MTDRVRDVLGRRYPSYHEPLWQARRWNRGGDPGELADAAELLAVLAEQKFPTVLRVWFEAALNRVKRGRRDEALELLADIDRRFGGRLDEDTYALWGRCHKDAGHAHLDRGLALPALAPTRGLAFEDADHEYARALVQYQKSYALAGNWFPGVNVAFLLFLRAGLAADRGQADESARLLGQSREVADKLTAGTNWLRRLPDDGVWHEAVRGEAEALRGAWDDAVRRYELALARPEVQPHHRDSIGRQLRRVVQACRLLGRPAPDDLAARLPDLAAQLSPATVP